MKTICSLISLVTCVSALSACASNKPVDLGDDKTSTTAQGLAAYEGAWDGYVEAYKFASGSDRVRITLDAEGQGTIEVGDAPAIPPFTNPNIAYPTTDPTTDLNAFLEVQASDTHPHEGYGYPVGDAAVRGGRISFTFWATDLQKAWCEAQTSYYAFGSGEETHYNCVKGGGGGPMGDGSFCADDEGNKLDCGFINTCLIACSCGVSSCTSRRDSATEIQVDGALDADGKALVGTLVLPDTRTTIRLERQ